jgi:hypothetical protein
MIHHESFGVPARDLWPSVSIQTRVNVSLRNSERVLSECYGAVTLVGKHHATYKIDAQIEIVHQVTIHERASMQIFDDIISNKANPQFPHQVLGPFE